MPKRRLLSKTMETTSTLPIVKPVKEDNRDASKYRLISLLYIAGKDLERLILARIMHHVHTSVGLNNNHYGFVPQNGSLDVEKAVKKIIEENLKQKYCTAVVSLDIRGAFDAACWPIILHKLKNSNARGNSSINPEIFLAIELHRYAGKR